MRQTYISSSTGYPTSSIDDVLYYLCDMQLGAIASRESQCVYGSSYLEDELDLFEMTNQGLPSPPYIV